MQIGGPGISPALINSWYLVLKDCAARIEFDWSARKPHIEGDTVVYRGQCKILYPHLNDSECADIQSYFSFVGKYADAMRDYV